MGPTQSTACGAARLAARGLTVDRHGALANTLHRAKAFVVRSGNWAAGALGCAGHARSSAGGRMVPPPGWPPGPLGAVQGPVEALFVQSWGVAVHTTYALQ